MTDRVGEDVFGLLYECGPDAAFVIERTHWSVVSANLRCVDLFERTVEELRGMTLQELSYEPARDLTLARRYEDVTFKRGNDLICVTLEVTHLQTHRHGEVAAYLAHDVSEKRMQEAEIRAKHRSVLSAYAELERTNSALELAKIELETRNGEIALLAWHATMGELVAGIAHHLNNPIGALVSTVRRLGRLSASLPIEIRTEQERLLSRADQLARRIESKVSAIVHASRSNAFAGVQQRSELPRELELVLAAFAERMDDIITKGPS